MCSHSGSSVGQKQASPLITSPVIIMLTSQVLTACLAFFSLPPPPPYLQPDDGRTRDMRGMFSHWIVEYSSAFHLKGLHRPLLKYELSHYYLDKSQMDCYSAVFICYLSPSGVSPVFTFAI